jgi:hypothetical protein
LFTHPASEFSVGGQSNFDSNNPRQTVASRYRGQKQPAHRQKILVWSHADFNPPRCNKPAIHFPEPWRHTIRFLALLATGRRYGSWNVPPSPAVFRKETQAIPRFFTAPREIVLQK